MAINQFEVVVLRFVVLLHVTTSDHRNRDDVCVEYKAVNNYILFSPVIFVGIRSLLSPEGENNKIKSLVIAHVFPSELNN